MNFYVPILKSGDGDKRLIVGYASTEAQDSQGEIVTRAALEGALPDYMRFANIREMHQPSAVGVATDAVVDGKGLMINATIVDDEAWKKVKAGVYKGLSIGGRVLARADNDKNIITRLELYEISLVDRPANPEAVVRLWKNDGPEPGPAAAAPPPAPDRFERLEARIADLAKRLDGLAREPARPSVALRAVEKVESAVDDRAEAARIDKLPMEQRALALIKLAQRVPSRIGR